jgi:hypothetical protein
MTLPIIAALLMSQQEQITHTSGTRNISGVYPHLTTYAASRVDGVFNLSGHNECGIGAIVPWADKLWMITYAPHKPLGSEHKLYSIDKQMNMTIHPESVGGTPAGRMIHVESEQLIIGHYFIGKSGEVRVIQPKEMPGRITAVARHLDDPANKVYMVDMENMIYEVNVHTLEFKKLFHDPIPGYHAKGAFTAQGRLVVSNNGETSAKSLDNWDEWQVSQEFRNKGPADKGALTTWDGKEWTVIERRQYTEVTGPGGVLGIQPDSAPLWTVGWDKRSLRLQVLHDGDFHLYLLPKASLNNDASHGWFTEWPRIREIGEGRALMDMHGMFFDFPLTFTPETSAGIRPIGRHLRYVPDFTYWNGQLVIATDEASIQGNPLVGQPQSNLWFGQYEDLKTWGERSAAGSIWMEDSVTADQWSPPFLVAGFEKRVGHFVSDKGVVFTLEIDREGDGSWEPYASHSVLAGKYRPFRFEDDFEAEWLRVKASEDCTASVSFHFSDTRSHDPKGPGKTLFDALADAGAEEQGLNHLLFPTNESRDLEVVTTGEKPSYQEFDHLSFEFKQGSSDPDLLEKLTPEPSYSVDEASVIIESEGRRLRLPKSPHGLFDAGTREHREVESERLLANIQGTFYEVPFWIVGEPPLYTKMKPVASHNKQIMDFTTWRGLLVISGVKADAAVSEHVYRSKDGEQALWFGGIDDLWQLGKPVGVGGPWKDTDVKAKEPSDAYLMNGFDRKVLTLKADRKCTITLQVDFDLTSGFHDYRKFTLEPGEEQTFTFPDGFNAHWLRVIADSDCTATAQLTYS